MGEGLKRAFEAAKATTPRRARRPDPNRAATLMRFPLAECKMHFGNNRWSCCYSIRLSPDSEKCKPELTAPAAWKAAASALKLEVG